MENELETLVERILPTIQEDMTDTELRTHLLTMQIAVAACLTTSSRDRLGQIIATSQQVNQGDESLIAIKKIARRRLRAIIDSV